jgi:hypothetical protein
MWHPTRSQTNTRSRTVAYCKVRFPEGQEQIHGTCTSSFNRSSVKKIKWKSLPGEFVNKRMPLYNFIYRTSTDLGTKLQWYIQTIQSLHIIIQKSTHFDSYSWSRCSTSNIGLLQKAELPKHRNNCTTNVREKQNGRPKYEWRGAIWQYYIPVVIHSY